MTAPAGWGLADGAVILIVDADDADARLIELMLAESFGSAVAVSRVPSREAALRRLEHGGCGCVLLGLGVSDGDGADAVRQFVLSGPGVPLIVITNDDNVDVAMSAVRAGAQDYLVRGRSSVDSVGRAVRYALGRTQTEQILAHATSLLEGIVEASMDAIFSKTVDGVVTSWNAGAQRMFGYSALEMIGSNISTIVPPDRSEELTLLLRLIKEGVSTRELETKRRRKDGSTVAVWSSVSPIRDAAGRVVGSSTVSRDMSQHHRTEEESRALHSRIERAERLESLGKLAGGVAHDFNNMLAVIMNYAAFVAQATADLPTVLADVEQIQIAAGRAAELTKRLLLFARRDMIRPEVLDVNDVVTDFLALFTPKLGELTRFAVDQAGDLPSIEADRGQIEQVLLNLTINARDAMVDGGTITIRTRCADPGVHRGRGRTPVASRRYVELVVSDNGSGMSAEVTDHIFDPFFTARPIGETTGLGLAIVHGIVTQAGGTVTVQSEEGIGTAFNLYFPAVDRLAGVAVLADAARTG